MRVHCGTVHNSKDLKQTQMPINNRLDTKSVVYIYTMEYYAVIKKNEFMTFAEKWMNLGSIILSKLTQKQKSQHCMFSLTSGR